MKPTSFMQQQSSLHNQRRSECQNEEMTTTHANLPLSLRNKGPFRNVFILSSHFMAPFCVFTTNYVCYLRFYPSGFLPNLSLKSLFCCVRANESVSEKGKTKCFMFLFTPNTQKHEHESTFFVNAARKFYLIP